MRRQVTFAHPAVEPLSTAITNLESCTEPLHVLHYRAIQIWDTDFKAMGHGELVRVHEQFIGQGGADFEKLKASKLIGMLYLRQQFAPIID